MGIQEWRLRGRKPLLGSVGDLSDDLAGKDLTVEQSEHKKAESASSVLLAAIEPNERVKNTDQQHRTPDQHKSRETSPQEPETRKASDDAFVDTAPLPQTTSVGPQSLLTPLGRIEKDVEKEAEKGLDVKNTGINAAKDDDAAADSGIVMPELRPAPVPLDTSPPIDLSMEPQAEANSGSVESALQNSGEYPIPNFRDVEIPSPMDDPSYVDVDSIWPSDAASELSQPVELGVQSEPVVSELSELDWRALLAKISDNSDCPSCGKAHSILGFGDVLADWMFICDAPTSAEVQAQQLFVGRAGQLYDAILEACALNRNSVYTSTIFKCAPPDDLSVSPQCNKLIHRQIELVKPKFIITFGEFAAQALLQTNDSFDVLIQGPRSYRVGQADSKKAAYNSVVITSHSPSALLAQPELKAELWQAIKKFL